MPLPHKRAWHARAGRAGSGCPGVMGYAGVNSQAPCWATARQTMFDSSSDVQNIGKLSFTDLQEMPTMIRLLLVAFMASGTTWPDVIRDRTGGHGGCRWRSGHRRDSHREKCSRRLDDGRARRASQDHGRRSCDSLRYPLGEQPSQGGQASPGGLAKGSRRLHGDVIRRPTDRAAGDRQGAQRRSLCRREQGGTAAGTAGCRRRRQARSERGFRHPPGSSVWNRFLSAWPAA